MKFSKEFVSQMVPEWQEAYLDYNYLKSKLKEIRLCSLRNRPTSTPRSLKRRSTMNRAFSGLTQRNNHHREDTNTTGGDIEDQVILVDMVKPKGREGVYETMFLMLNEEGGHNELEFFRKLDDEFNKVNRFYKSKVEEVMEEATFLNKQMDALIAFRVKVQNIVNEATGFSAAMNRLSSNDDDAVAASAAAAISASSSPSGAGISGEIDIHEKEGYEPTSEGKFKYSDNEKQMEIKTTTETPLDILNRVKINSKNETPYSTIKYILKVERDRSSNFGKENLKNVEEQLTRAFIEFYQKIRILKNFSFLNLTAISKILKKYDKVTSRTASKTYLRMVDSSYIGNSDEVNRLVEKVEATFIKHFSNSNRRNGMNKLRLKPKREKHRTTFSLGFFTGCIIALLLALILIIHARQIMKKEGFARYMDNMFPLYSLFAFVVLHMAMYAANIYFWRRYRINYPFIFGFKKGTELGYREVFLLSTCLATLALAGVLANLDMEMDENTEDYQTLTELVPLGLLTLVLIITFCPFNIVYRSSRFFLLCCVFHCICAPLYKVTLPDFFLADQFTSQIQALRSLQFYICYYGWGDFRQRQNTCNTSNIYITFDFIVAAIPYLLRLLQCLRRLFEERNTMEGYNGLKYFSTIVAILVRTAYSRERGQVWLTAAVITSAVATIYTTYWDLVVDWGLLQRHSKNGWLRDKLILPHKSVYFVVMVLNVLLRLAWLQTVLNFQVPFLHRQSLIAVVAILEIIRRGIWNFFRLENEHLNNVGMYRAFISVPLPFNYDEEEDRDK